MNLLSHQAYWLSGSTTSTYALTNPNTWPIGVFVRLVIESGAIVAGERWQWRQWSVVFEMEVAEKKKMVETVERHLIFNMQ